MKKREGNYRNQYGPCREMKDGKIQCNICKQWLPANNHFFGENKHIRYGLRHTCKQCRRDALQHKTDRRWSRISTKPGYYICTSCGVEKELIPENFNKCSYNNNGFKGVCRTCRAEERLKNRKRKAETDKKYRLANLDKLRVYKQRYFQNHKHEVNEQMKNRRKDDLYYALTIRLRNRISAALRRGFVKSKKTHELLGCSYDEFKIYFESLFTDGMTWDLFLKGEIHIDHIVPIAYFDLNDIEQQKQCFNYKNLQPLYAFDNLSKNSDHDGVRLRQNHDKKNK